MPGLHGWALLIPVGAINAAVTRQWPQQFTATFTLEKPLARIGWHGFNGLSLTFGAGKGRG